MCYFTINMYNIYIITILKLSTILLNIFIIILINFIYCGNIIGHSLHNCDLLTFQPNKEKIL